MLNRIILSGGGLTTFSALATKAAATVTSAPAELGTIATLATALVGAAATIGFLAHQVMKRSNKDADAVDLLSRENLRLRVENARLETENLKLKGQ